MNEKVKKLIKDIRNDFLGVFRPLPTREEAESSFSHRGNCTTRKYLLVGARTIAFEGFSGMVSWERPTLTCPECKTVKDFRE